MLYSYLLTKNDFLLPSPPTDGLRDKTFAYHLYQNLLRLVLDLGGIGKKHAGVLKCFADNSVVRALATDLEVRNITEGHLEGYHAIYQQIDRICRAISDTHAYRSYVRKKNHDVETDALFLTEVLEGAIKTDETFFKACRQMADFTNVGYEEGFRMVTDTLQSYSDNRQSLLQAQKSLKFSLDKGYELYHALLQLIVELTDQQALHLDNQKHKHLPTVEDLNPNTKFVDNRLALMLSQSAEMTEYFKENPFSWDTANSGLVKRLLSRILESDIYADYMASDESSLLEDCEFWRNILKKIIFPSDDLAEALENMSVYWNDDINIMDSFVLKTIKRAATEGKLTILPKYKDDEDARFGAELFRYAIENREYYRSLIDMFIDSKQWDSERLAFMDIVILTVAIAELLNYPAIPIAVTLNEFIEIANCYSTAKSGQFINGVLYSVINYLHDNGQLKK